MIIRSSNEEKCLILTSSVRMSIWSRICRPRHSTGLWPGSSQRRPPRTRHSDAEPDGSHPGLSPHTVVAVKGQRERSNVGVPNQHFVDYRRELCGVVVKRKRDLKTHFQILLEFITIFFLFFNLTIWFQPLQRNSPVWTKSSWW